MNSVADSSSIRDLLALAKKNAAAQESNAKGRWLDSTRGLQYFTCSPISKIEFLCWKAPWVSLLVLIRLVSRMVEWYWKDKAEAFWDKPVPKSLCPAQMSCGMFQGKTWGSSAKGRWLTAGRPIPTEGRSKWPGHSQLVYSLGPWIAALSAARGGTLANTCLLQVFCQHRLCEEQHISVMLRISVRDLQHCVENAPSICGVRSDLQSTAQRTTLEITHNLIFLALLLRFFQFVKAVEDYRKPCWTYSLRVSLSSDALSSIQVAILINVWQVTVELRA
jgi:hypothetical protein